MCNFNHFHVCSSVPLSTLTLFYSHYYHPPTELFLPPPLTLRARHTDFHCPSPGPGIRPSTFSLSEFDRCRNLVQKESDKACLFLPGLFDLTQCLPVSFIFFLLRLHNIPLYVSTFCLSACPWTCTDCSHLLATVNNSPVDTDVQISIPVPALTSFGCMSHACVYIHTYTHMCHTCGTCMCVWHVCMCLYSHISYFYPPSIGCLPTHPANVYCVPAGCQADTTLDPGEIQLETGLPGGMQRGTVRCCAA